MFKCLWAIFLSPFIVSEAFIFEARRPIFRIDLAQHGTPSTRVQQQSTPTTIARAQQSNADPFRPSKHPLDPMVINVLQRSLFRSSSTIEDVIAEAKLKRASDADTDDKMSSEEWDIVEARVRGVTENRAELEVVLQKATDAAPWIAKFRAGGDFGLPIEAKDPTELVALNRCECLLALWMLRSDSEVAFMDEDRLGVLTLKVAKEALEKIDLL